jgi:hypothetical protein
MSRRSIEHSGHGRAEASRGAAQELEYITQTGACLHASFAEIPKGPLLLVANEFFDALPVHEFELHPEGWRERVVASDGERLVFGWAEPGPSFALLTDRQRIGAWHSICRGAATSRAGRPPVSRRSTRHRT